MSERSSSKRKGAGRAAKEVSKAAGAGEEKAPEERLESDAYAKAESESIDKFALSGLLEDEEEEAIEKVTIHQPKQHSRKSSRNLLSLKEYIDEKTEGGKDIVDTMLEVVGDVDASQRNTILIKLADMYKASLGANEESPIDKLSTEDIRKEIIKLDEDIAELKENISLFSPLPRQELHAS